GDTLAALARSLLVQSINPLAARSCAAVIIFHQSIFKTTIFRFRTQTNPGTVPDFCPVSTGGAGGTYKHFIHNSGIDLPFSGVLVQGYD
ncbi:MAG: hypothetical protein KGI37_09215, partial [Alphaproteobacteria bacterium]|nr:hypothetical protein [Alphaproteobacteria bacterium]